MDDDGDGLIDLYDDECVCTGVSQITDQTDKIPNPDFENYSVCPTTWSQIDYCTGWERGTFGTSDYLNTCGYVTLGVQSAGLVPFPSGEGCTGAYFTETWKEYVATCLTTQLSSGLDYELTFSIAACSVLDGFMGCSPFSYAPVNVTLWGGPDCAFPVPSTGGCPSNADPDWVPLGTVTYSPIAEWAEVSISFTAPSAIAAIMLGPPCVVPPGYGGPACFPFVVFDDLHLFGEDIVQDLSIVDIGATCDADYSLSAEIEFQDPGTWQWYWNGVALVGQTGQELLLSENNYQSGVYQVTFTSGNGCAMDSLSVVIPENDTTIVELSFCPDSEIECAGEIFSVEGAYEVVLPGYNGCDSVVRCVLETYDLPPVTYLAFTSCAPFATEVCGTIINQSGHYEVVCEDARGCDSLVIVDIQILDPLVVLNTPDTLGCDSSVWVTIDGSLSTVNNFPNGQTFYSWSGPAGGIQGNSDEPWVSVSLPGEYCLMVTHESEGVSCADTGCVTVQRSVEFPEPPLLNGPAGGCPGDTISVHLSGQGNAPITTFYWTVDPGIDHQIVNDSVLQVVLTGLDTIRLCANTGNNCGVSDTSCIQVITSFGDSTLTFGKTCDPAMVGEVAMTYQNRFGCDSVVVTQTTLWPSSSMEITGGTCDSSLVGVDTLVYQNLYGCDSIIILKTELWPSQSQYEILYTCDSNQAGIDTLVYQNQYGCDSLIYRERVFTGIYQESGTVALCGPGIDYQDTLLVTTGPCDSLWITQYVYRPGDSTLLQLTTCDPALAGIVENMYANQWGCDSLVVTETIYVGSDTQYVQVQTCDPAQAGTNILVLAGMYCDSVVVTETVWVAAILTRDTLVNCDAAVSVVDTMTFTSSGGCDSLVITLREGGSFTLIADPQAETCAGDEDGQILVSSTGGGVAPFQYRLDQGGWQTTPAFSDLSPGLYSIEVEDSRGCVNMISGITIAAGQVVQVDAGPDRVVLEGEVETFMVTSIPPATGWQWTALDPLDCPTCPQTQLGPVSQAQDVVVTVVTEQSCVGTDLVKISLADKPDDPVKVYVPNSFTPNGDGINDVFSVYGNDQVLIVRNLAIFDRWGNALYSRSDLHINNPSAGWDGTFRDEVMDPGVYIYVVEVELVDGSMRLFKGDVTVTR